MVGAQHRRSSSSKREAASGRLGMLILGRERGGFDPSWGEQIEKSLEAFRKRTALHWHGPSLKAHTMAEVKVALARLREAGVDILVLTQPTMSDGRFAPVIAANWGAPVVLWATPERQTGEMISSNSLVGTHVYGATVAQLGYSFELVYGHPDEPDTEVQLTLSVAALSAVNALRQATVGLIGHHAPGFIDLEAHADELSNLLGVELYHQSTIEFLELYDSLPKEAVIRALEDIRSRPIHRGSASDGMLETAARYYAALKAWMERSTADAVAIQCWPDHPTNLGHWPYVALSLLATDGVAAVQEGDVDGALSAYLAEKAGLGPVYLSDWLEHDAETFACWHTGVIPLQFCCGYEDADVAADQGLGEKGPRFAAHFNNKKPLVIEGTLDKGQRVTVFRMWRARGSYHMVAFEGHTEEPRRQLLGTNGLVRAQGINVGQWFRRMLRMGMPHHVSIVRGHHMELLEHVAYHLGARWHGSA